MTIQDALRQLETAGYFAKAAAGDSRAASYFVRQAAYLANPTGDPNGWGWLSKSTGETNVDGYAEDSLVLGAAPSNLTNVYDFVGGTGAPGARVLYTASPVQRRPTNTWVRPVPLTVEEMRYIAPAGSGGGGPVDPPPSPVPCRFQPTNLDGLQQEVQATYALVAALSDELATHRAMLELLRQQHQQTLNLLNDFDARFRAGFSIDANSRYLGRISGTVKG